MNAHILLVVRFIAFASSLAMMGCTPRTTGRWPDVAPFAEVSVEQDEWLHAHCEAKAVVTAKSVEEGAALVRKNNANFGEVVHTRVVIAELELHAVAFACPTRPPWATADKWVALDGPTNAARATAKK